MKNIHVLPTDKLTKLHFDTKLFLSANYQISREINSIVQGRNIYITSDEEIKDGTWVIQKSTGKFMFLAFTRSESYNKNEDLKEPFTKIILTTDQDLIKDGVQKIDDKFLEWFVKNPICDEIEIEKRKLLQGTTFYKIIIPKEEPKQETPEEETLSKIKFVLSCNNYAQAIRLLEQYGQWQQERSYSEEDMRKAIQETITLMRYKATEFREHENTVIEQFKKK